MNTTPRYEHHYGRYEAQQIAAAIQTALDDALDYQPPPKGPTRTMTVHLFPHTPNTEPTAVRYVEEGEELTADDLTLFADLPLCVWLTTDNGIDPLICCKGSEALDLAEQLCNNRIGYAANLIACCHTTGDACPRDVLDPAPTVVTVLRTTAERHGIVWPTDIAE